MRLLFTRLLALIFMTFGAESTSASEIYAPAPNYAGVTYGPVLTWTGFYLGAHVGGDWGALQITDVNGFSANAGPGTKTNANPDGVFGGITFGYNRQRGDWLFGFEADLGGMGISTNKAIIGSTSNTRIGVDDGFYGDVTGRFGYACGGMLYYAKGGFGFLDANRKFSSAGTFTAGSNDTFLGWTLGAGVEWIIDGAWSLKVEYAHFDFGSQDFTVTPGSFRFREDLTAKTVKGGFAYHFYDEYLPLK
jgi:outer membrane immunogenic protein